MIIGFLGCIIFLMLTGQTFTIGTVEEAPKSFDIPSFRRNAFLETGKILDDAPFLGFATTSGKLFDLGRYPGMIEGN